MDDAAPSWQNDSFPSFNTTAFMSPVVDQALKALSTAMLGIVMVSVGCTMELSKIKMHFLKPKGLVIALLSQYGVMPFTAFCLAKAFQLTDIRALVILISGCSPGGNLSNVFTLALMGDINLSIVMTACSMLLALGMMPLLLLIYCQGFPQLQEAMPYTGLVISLSLLIIASGVGILLNFYRPRYAKIVKKVGFSLALACLLAILVIIAMELSFWKLMSPPLLVSAALMPLIGYTFGYLISSLCKLSEPERRTVAIETGCQNTQLCGAILVVAFPPAVMGPLFMFPLVLSFFQLTEGAVIAGLFRCHRRFMQKKKVPSDKAYEPAPTDDIANVLL
ncbi:hepatic sodium/bile acid cotransporter [Platichthys flesus]|uniref:hepatic sodium/bile acid cotransporter n=1 Tax=Platichthys flesus TaxID=8260 RepID=UPI002DBDBC26|nr:hepatic sodium/bile acid cotransporter [Platichthys flesus]XP_062267364.1 hepatic sodium/bile acid cotransporter [Platichthys flesus]XP_062267365.1 hepatic sodium/bile acid cotransporter [Platichthys flesus]